MTAEAFIKEKLIPWLEKQQSFMRESIDSLPNTDIDRRHFQGGNSALIQAQFFIEQHRTEWEGK